MESFVFNKTYVALFCAILCFGWSIQDKIHIHVQPSIAQVFRDKSEMCSKETGVPASMMKQMITGGEIPDDDAVMKFLYCVSYNSGYTDIDGHFIVEEITKLQVMNGTKEDYVNTIKNCNKMNFENRLDTIRAMGLCIHKDYFYTV